MAELTKLDVTKLEPQFRHSTIFQYVDALDPGEAFIIHVDHDPVPLRYQLEQTRDEKYEWDYLQSGPEIWEVKLSRKS